MARTKNAARRGGGKGGTKGAGGSSSKGNDTASSVSKGTGGAGGKKSQAKLPLPRKKVVQKVFRFLELPIELRLRIYGFVFPCHRGYVRFFNKGGPFSGKIKPANVKINLLRVNKQIHGEALPILYQANTFCITPLVDANSKEVPERTLNDKWINSMPLEGRNNILSIEMRLPFPGEINTDPYMDMSALFPKLRNITYFFDSVTREDFASPFSYVSGQKQSTRDDYVKFFATLKELMPKAANVYLDFAMVENYEKSNDLISAATTVLSNDDTGEYRRGSSKHVEQEEAWAKEYHDRDDAVMKLLREENGEGANYYEDQLGY